MPLDPNLEYVITSNGQLLSYDPSTGEELLVVDGLQQYGDLAITSDGVPLGFGFTGAIAGQIFAIDPDTGAETLFFDTGENTTSSALGLDNNDNIYFSSENNTEISVAFLDPGTGTYGAPQVILTGQSAVFDILLSGPDQLYYLHEVAGDQRITLLQLEDDGTVTELFTADTPDNDVFGLTQDDDGNIFAFEGSGEAYSFDMNAVPPFTAINPVDPVPRTGGDRIFGAAGFGICFAKGTMIDTPIGAKPIEYLDQGDIVVTYEGAEREIRWIGRRRVAATGKFAPIVIGAGVLGNDKDLVVSQLHRVLVTSARAELLFGETEVLVEARALLQDDRVYVRQGGEVVYFHILLDQHEILIADGGPAESLFLGPRAYSALTSAQRDEIMSIFPELDASADDATPRRLRCLSAFEARTYFAA